MRRGFAVITGHQYLNIRRQGAIAQLFYALFDSAGNVHRVFTGLFGDGQGNRRKNLPGLANEASAGGTLMSRAKTGHYTLVGHCIAAANAGDIFQVNRRTLLHTDHQAANLVHLSEQRSGLNRNRQVIAGDSSLLRTAVSRQQGLLQIVNGQTKTGQQGRIKTDIHPVGYAANGIHIAGSGHPFQSHFQHMRKAGELLATVAVQGVVKRERHHRHVVDAFGFDHWLAGTQIGGQPILIGIYLAIKPHQGFLARYAHFELHGNHRLALARYRIDMLNAGNFTHHLLGRRGNGAFDFTGAGTGKSHHDIGHSDVDLRLFFFRCDHHGQNAQNNGQQHNQRRQMIVLKQTRNGARKADFYWRGGRARRQLRW